jgi:two-component system, chemotaxis family, response regulator Rcp1
MPRRIRILLVEDNPGDVDLIRDTLQDVPHHLDITVLGDGEEAIDYLLRRRSPSGDEDSRLPDLILLDLNLPKMSGHDVLSEARKASELRSVPIVVLSSSDATRDVVTSYRLGANCHVTKPGELTAFQTTVKAVGNFWCGIARLPQ